MPEHKYKEERRETLKIIGAVGIQCAFPFAGDELYGQHAHMAPAGQADAGPPKHFSPAQFTLVEEIADLILPGSTKAAVANYIDLIVRNNPEHKKTYAAGFEWLEKQGYAKLSPEERYKLLEKLCEAVDRGEVKTPEQRFFRVMKSMTADGFFTSRHGLMTELGYKGNQVLAAFPACEIDEH
jgi:hypothetical protein